MTIRVYTDMAVLKPVRRHYQRTGTCYTIREGRLVPVRPRREEKE